MSVSEQPPPYKAEPDFPQPGYPPQASYPPQPYPGGQAPYAPGPPGGYQGYPPPGQPQPTTINATVVQQQQQQQVIGVPGATVIVARGNCPTCRVGVMTEQFTCCGVCLGIFLFPIGMICCFLLMEKRCSNCGATF